MRACPCANVSSLGNVGGALLVWMSSVAANHWSGRGARSPRVRLRRTAAHLLAESEGKRKREAVAAEAAAAVAEDAAPETANSSKSKERRTNDDVPPAASADAVTPKKGARDRRPQSEMQLRWVHTGWGRERLR